MGINSCLIVLHSLTTTITDSIAAELQLGALAGNVFQPLPGYRVVLPGGVLGRASHASPLPRAAQPARPAFQTDLNTLFSKADGLKLICRVFK